MKMLVGASCALLMVSLLGCSQQATSPAAARPAGPPPKSTATASGDVNTFGESKDPAGDSAAQARNKSYGETGANSSQTPSEPNGGNPPPPR